MKLKESRLFGATLVILATVFWSINGNIGAFLIANKELTPQHLVMLRLLIAGCILLTVHFLKDSKEFFNVFRKKLDILRIVGLATGGFMLSQLSYYVAISHSNAATATTLQQLSPFLVIVFATIYSRKLPQLKTVFSLFLAFTGAFFLVTHGKFNDLAISDIALIFGLLSAVGFALFNILLGSLQNKFSNIAVTGWSMLIGGLITWIVFNPLKTPFIVDIVSIVGILYVGVFGTLVPFLCYMKGAKIISPVTASILSLLETVFSTIIATTFMGVRFMYYDYLGIALVIIALFLIMTPGRVRNRD